MARSEEQNRIARERSREGILLAAIDLFGERGVEGASIAEITRRAGVSQGMVNYHFGGKQQLISAVLDRWFETLLGFAQAQGAAEERLAAVIDAALMATAHALPLQRAVIAMQQQPSTHRLFAESEQRHAAGVTAAEDAVRAVFQERGAADPALEEVMLRSTLEGIVVKYAVYGATFPLESARRWVYRMYGLPEPAEALPVASCPGDGSVEPRPRASGVGPR